MTSSLSDLLRPDLLGRTAYGAPQLDVPVPLNTNENSYAVPQQVVDAILASVAEVVPGLNRYPDREFVRLREDLAAYLTRTSGAAITAGQVWAGNGSNEVLLHILQAFGGAGRVALGFTPTYSMHSIITATVGTRWVDGQRGGSGGPFHLDVASAVAQVKAHQPNIVFLCSPNNPTGTALGLDVVEAVYDAAGQALVVVDEAYAEFARSGTPSALTLLAGRDRLVVTRTMSKAFALAGARVGYLAASPELTECLRLVRLPYHLSATTQAVACAALEHSEGLLAAIELVKVQRDRIASDLAEMGLDPVPSDANFVLFGGLADEKATWQSLLDQGILIRDVGLAHYLRVTAGTPQETEAFLGAMRRLAPTHRQEQSS
ncbi:MAG: histidinol-phosphate transaminase [Phycicoccus sp.]|nr:histidinol-phosphate transaminase [Phycicoccus sp.]NMM32566.1 histidinol-phosphate transaminase [Phycicoccus sp.]